MSARAQFSSGGLTGSRSTSELIHVIGRTNFLAVLRLRILASWLLVMGYCLFLEGVFSSLLSHPFHRHFVTWQLISSEEEESKLASMTESYVT